jgi:hypothetical protein
MIVNYEFGNGVQGSGLDVLYVVIPVFVWKDSGNSHTQKKKMSE